MFAISIITSWLVLPFQNVESNGEQMFDTKMPSHQQGRHTNILKMYNVAPTNHFIFSTNLFCGGSGKCPNQNSAQISTRVGLRNKTC